MKKSLYLLLCSILFIWASCNKDESNDPVNGSGATVRTTITGRVLDENGIAVSGAIVSCGNQSSTTNIWGLFAIEEIQVPAERAIVTVEKNGYWEYIGAVHPLSGKATTATISIYSNGQTHNLNSMTGGTITSTTGAGISFPPDAFEDENGNSYNGNVSITLHTLSPFEKYQKSKFPGTDGIAKKSNGSLTHIAPYASMGVEFSSSSGNKLRLKSGKKATITMPVHNKHLSIAPSAVSLWHFNETTAIWEEEGQAQRTGNNYSGEVSHFSWWTYSDPDAVVVNGKFTDCQGAALPNVWVETDSIYLTDSDLNGDYYFCLPPNFSIQIRGFSFGWYSIEYTNYATVQGQPPYGTYTVPSMQFSTIGCESSIYGQVVNCSGTTVNSTVVLIRNNQMVDYQYTNNGQFTFNLPDTTSGNFTVFAYKGIYSSSTQITTIPYDNYWTGNITLCDTTPLSNNVLLNFNSSLTGNLPISFDVSSANVIQNGGNYEITVNYVDSATQTNGVFKIINNIYSPGIYNWNGSTNTISGVLSFAGINYSITPSASSGSNTLTNTPQIGGNIKGQFTGPVVLTSTGFPNISGTLSGSFDVVRTQ